MLSAASLRAGPIAPGEVVVINGSVLGPAQMTINQPGDSGALGSSLSGVSVLFNDTPAALHSAQAGQIGAIVPYGIASASSAAVQVGVLGTPSNRLSNPVAPTAPAIFTGNSSGAGTALAFNDDSTVRSSRSPRPAKDRPIRPARTVSSPAMRRQRPFSRSRCGSAASMRR